tara:strand:+ start:91 stop:486 length:396 start_codon:yes stop_codon:yes gene_type:complete
MNSLKRLRNTLMRRSRSRRYNVVPEPEPESNHTDGRDFRYTNEYARRGRFDHHKMNQNRYQRPLTRNHLQKYQGNISKSTIGKRRSNRTKKGFTSPSRNTLLALHHRPVPGMSGFGGRTGRAGFPGRPYNN